MYFEVVRSGMPTLYAYLPEGILRRVTGAVAGFESRMDIDDLAGRGEPLRESAPLRSNLCFWWIEGA